jgi:aryl-alcohol dehydrogenase-like predicted oxidoreductase
MLPTGWRGRRSTSLRGEIPGMGRPVSRLVLGSLYADEPRTWGGIADAFIAGGGDCFDTAFVYGDGRAEEVLGAWLRDRRLREEVVLIGKGGHPPDCWPERLRGQLEVSLNRLRSDRMDVYMVHRDDPSVPVGEFVDAMHELLSCGLVSAYGMSNWSMARLDEARAWAGSHGITPPAAVSNQLSLAQPATAEIWPGAVSASGPDWETWLTRTRLALLAWSSQAEGFFATHPASERATSGHVLRTWYSPANLERRRRALDLAAARGVDGSNVALAWVLRRPHPTYAIFGAENADEVTSALRAADLDLTDAESAWLELTDECGWPPRSEPGLRDQDRA